MHVVLADGHISIAGQRHTKIKVSGVCSADFAAQFLIPVQFHTGGTHPDQQRTDSDTRIVIFIIRDHGHTVQTSAIGRAKADSGAVQDRGHGIDDFQNLSERSGVHADFIQKLQKLCTVKEFAQLSYGDSILHHPAEASAGDFLHHRIQNPDEPVIVEFIRKIQIQAKIHIAGRPGIDRVKVKLICRVCCDKAFRQRLICVNIVRVNADFYVCLIDGDCALCRLGGTVVGISFINDLYLMLPCSHGRIGNPQIFAAFYRHPPFGTVV